MRCWCHYDANAPQHWHTTINHFSYASLLCSTAQLSFSARYTIAGLENQVNFGQKNVAKMYNLALMSHFWADKCTIMSHYYICWTALCHSAGYWWHIALTRSISFLFLQYVWEKSFLLGRLYRRHIENFICSLFFYTFHFSDCLLLPSSMTAKYWE